MNTKEFIKSIDMIAKEKNIDIDIIEDAIRCSIVSAYKKKFPKESNIQAIINKEKKKIQLFKGYSVVDEITDEQTQILKKNVPTKYRKEANETGFYYKEVILKDFGRLAIQAAKQLLLQNIELARRDSLYDEFKDKIGQILTGKITSIDNNSGNLIINLGKGESIFYKREQVPGEFFKIGQLIDVYLVDVIKDSRGVSIIVSRKHPGYVKKLLEKEIPEIASGLIKIKSIAREASLITKVAVYSDDPHIDVVGACIGQNKNRITGVLQYLGKEKIQIIKWSEDIETYIANSLEPSKVLTVILDEEDEDKESLVIVPDDEYSLAIGKKGQNAKLAVILTGWKINIKSLSEAKDLGIEL